MAALTGHMLVVDDNRMNRLVLGHSLEQEGHSVEFAENGKQALEMMRAHTYDLILLDVLMPEMNGYEVLAEVHADPHLKYIPVVMVSSIDELDSVVKCLEMGAEDYLPKPFKPALLRARVNSTLEKKQLRDRQRELFSKFATQEVADQLLETGFALGGKHVVATAMFSDIRSFTTITESQSADDTIGLLNTYFRHMFSAVESEGGIISQIIGDGLLSIFGAPLPQVDHRERAVVAALKMVDHVELFNREQKHNNRVQIKIGIGIASGDMVVGIIGTEKRAVYTCLGDTVNQAARLEAHTKVVGEPILIDENTRQGLSSDLRVKDQGEAMLKGKTVPVHTYSVPPLTL